MMLKFPILSKRVVEGKVVDSNQEDNWGKIQKKLKEESKELVEAIDEADYEHISEETFDLIQVCVRSLVLLEKKNMNLTALNHRHNQKLMKRGWESENVVGILIEGMRKDE